MSMTKKKHRLQVSLSQISLGLLEEMTKEKGLSKSVLIDLAIQNEYKEAKNERNEKQQS